MRLNELCVIGPSMAKVAGSFSNPNGGINQKTLDWLCRCTSSQATSSSGAERGDEGAPEGPGTQGHALLELYCGCGNHTVALAGTFDTVVAVEINPDLTAAAQHNLRLNGVRNARVVCAPSGDFCEQVMMR